MPKKSSPPKKSFWDSFQIPPFPVCWNRIKSLRKNLGLKPIEIAFKTGISLQTLYSLEAGYDSQTMPETKKKLCDFFGCEVSDLFPVEMIGPITKAEYFQRKLTADQEALAKPATEK